MILKTIIYIPSHELQVYNIQIIDRMKIKSLQFFYSAILAIIHESFNKLNRYS